MAKSKYMSKDKPSLHSEKKNRTSIDGSRTHPRSKLRSLPNPLLLVPTLGAIAYPIPTALLLGTAFYFGGTAVRVIVGVSAATLAYEAAQLRNAILN